MQRLFIVLSAVLLLSACTKEVPESDKKMAKSIDDKNVQETIDSYYHALNSGDIEKAASLMDNNFRGILPDMSEITGINSFKDNLKLFLAKYPGCKWDVKTTEINTYGDIAYSSTTASMTVNNQTTKKIDIYTEKAVRILKKQKNDGWKFFRFITLQKPEL